MLSPILGIGNVAGSKTDKNLCPDGINEKRKKKNKEVGCWMLESPMKIIT